MKQRFKYFANAALESVTTQGPATCDCCQETKTPIYTGPFYSIHSRKNLCLECIESGNAAEKFNGSFSDIVVFWKDENGVEQVIDEEAAKVPDEVISEIDSRTPGYETWQGNPWMFHCRDGAVFKGDASAEDVLGANSKSKEYWEQKNKLKWDEVMNGYGPNSHIAVYRFDCRHCDLTLFHWDMT